MQSSLCDKTRKKLTFFLFNINFFNINFFKILLLFLLLFPFRL